jgi:hypothetical protein
MYNQRPCVASLVKVLWPRKNEVVPAVMRDEGVHFRMEAIFRRMTSNISIVHR